MKKQPKIYRFLKHLISNDWQVSRYFTEEALKRIENATFQSEKSHLGEIRFVVEAGLHPYEILFNKTPRKRALELFGRLNIWDTEHNNGVLIYLLLADRDVEIVVDRGIHQLVDQSLWEQICKEMETLFKRGDFETGVLQGIEKVSTLLTQHFPANLNLTTTKKSRLNEISDKPLVL